MRPRDELVARGVDVGEVFDDAGGGLAGGFAPARTGVHRSESRRPFLRSFSDPNGKRLLYETTERLPGRV